jgi:hypothetical protein
MPTFDINFLEVSRMCAVAAVAKLLLYLIHTLTAGSGLDSAISLTVHNVLSGSEEISLCELFAKTLLPRYATQIAPFCTADTPYASLVAEVAHNAQSTYVIRLQPRLSSTMR